MEPVTVLDRFWAFVDQSGQCWTWQGRRTTHGYGLFSLFGRSMQAHRFAYEVTVGPIEADLTLDHLCGNKRCVRPDHLEPVTRAENIRRYYAGRSR